MHDAADEQQDLALRMADLARMIALRTVEEVLVEVSSAATELIAGADAAGVLLIGIGDTHQTLAPTSDLMFKLDDLQMTTEEGPCLQAARDDVAVVRVDDFGHETRFPRYCPQVITLGVLSALSFKLYAGQRTAGALNVFGFQPRPWDADAETIGMVLAAHAASAIVASHETERRQSALITRDRIGQAKGIIMERCQIDDVQAFGMLQKSSQDTNTALVDVAQRVIDTR